MKVAFAYAGQGSQCVGMGRELYEQYPTARDYFDGIHLDFDVRKLCFDGPMEQLSQTEYTQPCLVAVAVAATKLLRENGVVPALAAGLSLGEYSALYCAGAMDEQTTIELARFRGRAMEQATKNIPCRMMAVLGMERDALQALCEEASALGVVQISNYNCPGQLVIGGERKAVDHAADLVRERYAKRCLPLNVSGPFHTSLMHPAAERLARRLQSVRFSSLRFPVVFNATARPLADRESIPELLERQVESGVLFEDSIRFMQREGIDTVVEIGPGRVLSGFIKKTAGDRIRTYSVEDGNSLRTTIEALKGAS